MNSYGKLSTAFYDLDKPVAPQDAIAFYLSRALDSKGPVLEPMCGSGRFLIPLLQAGISIDGVDASSAMLAACRRRAKILGLVPTLYGQSLEALSLPRQYRLAFIPSGSIGLIHRKEAFCAGLRALRRHLSPGATLFIELVDRAALEAEPTAGSRSVSFEDDSRIHYDWQTMRDPGDDTVCWSGRYQLRRAGYVLAEEVEEIVLKMYDVADFLDELHLAGFSGAQALHATAEMLWLRDSGCSLYECKTSGGNADA